MRKNVSEVPPKFYLNPKNHTARGSALIFPHFQASFAAQSFLGRFFHILDKRRKRKEFHRNEARAVLLYSKFDLLRNLLFLCLYYFCVLSIFLPHRIFIEGAFTGIRIRHFYPSVYPFVSLVLREVKVL